MKVYVSYKSYLWNFKGYEPPIYERYVGKVLDLPIEKITEKSIIEIKEILTKEQMDEYKKLTPFGSTEVAILGITRLDEEG